MLTVVLLNLKHLELDFLSFFIIIFCFYCLLSILWGAKIKVVAQIVLPFIVYFSTTLFVKNKEDIGLLLLMLCISYAIPIFGSFIEIIRGQSLSHTEWLTGIGRYSGLFKKIHMMATVLFFFSVIFYLRTVILSLTKRYYKYILIIMLLISLYCIYKTYTRTTFIGLFLFWAFSLFGLNKKYFLIFIVISIIVIIFNFPVFQQIFFKTKDFQVQTASSGRSYIWDHNIKLFFRYNITEKLLGRGLGVGSVTVIGGEDDVWSSHNDYLHLLMHTGVIGLSLYVMIHIAIIQKLFVWKTETKIKYFYLGFFISIIFMNFVNGIITYQLSTAQLFWLIIGFLGVFGSHKSNEVVSLKN